MLDLKAFDEIRRSTFRYQINPKLITIQFGDEYNLCLENHDGPSNVVILKKDKMSALALAIQGRDHRVIFDSLSFAETMTFEEFDKELLELIVRLMNFGILSKDNRPFREPRKQKRMTVFSEMLNSPFFFKIPISNPDKFLGWLLPKLGWIFLPEAIVMGLIFSAMAIFGFFNAESKMEYEQKWYEEFLNLTSAIKIMAVMLILKIPHEIGHGLAMKWIGRKVYEMGIGFLLFTPCLYCDISEIYLEPKRSKRVLVVLAGVYIDILVTAFAAILFFISPPGELSNLARMTVYANLGFTMIVNLIPLTRFDGHYALAYLWGRQELGKDARSFLRYCVFYFAFLEDYVVNADIRSRDRFQLLTFGFLAFLYRWFLVFGIVGYLYVMGENIGLGPVTAVLGFAALMGLKIPQLAAWDQQAQVGR